MTIEENDLVWLKRTANYLGFIEMPADLRERAMLLRKWQPYNAAWELRLYLRCDIPEVRP